MEAVDDAVRRFLQGVSGDREALEDVLDEDVLGAGAAPGEVSDDRALLIRALSGESDSLDSTVVPVSIRSSSEDGTAWAWAEVEMRFGDGRRVPLRMTVVLRAREGSWRVSHWHTSVAVPNEEIFERIAKQP